MGPQYVYTMKGLGKSIRPTRSCSRIFGCRFFREPRSGFSGRMVPGRVRCYGSWPARSLSSRAKVSG